MKKGIICLLLLAGLLLCGCSDSLYYRQPEEESTVTEELSDPTPRYVFGDKGFYDTENDVEYLLEPGVTARERGTVLYSDDTNAIYTVEGIHESYFVCDGQRKVYRRSDKPWMVEPGAEGWEDSYPYLSYRGS